MKLIILLLAVLATPVWAQDDAVISIDDTVLGSQEQPKVLYIVPWKDADDDSLLSLELGTKIDSVFGHVERAEHLRKLEFIELLDSKE